MELDKIYNESCLTGLKKLPDNCIDCCVTSPPYFGLRDYGTDQQIGLEETPELFIQQLVNVFTEVKRVLKPEGTLWLNLGDTYANTNLGHNSNGYGNLTGISKKLKDDFRENRTTKIPDNLKAKDLIGIPWMAAFALRASGWYLRQDIIWAKPNPMPESVTDRCTKSHEYIFLMSKSAKYYYDHVSIMKDVAVSSISRLNQDIENQTGYDRVPGKNNGNMKASWNGSTFDKGKTGEMMETRGGRKSGNKERKTGAERGCPENTGSNVCGSVPWEGMKANKRSVWTVTTKPYKEAHFATYPEDLIVDMIKAGCPEGGVVLDPFMGAGTTALVAKKLNRHYIGYELNPDYIKIAEKRIINEIGLFI